MNAKQMIEKYEPSFLNMRSVPKFLKVSEEPAVVVWQEMGANRRPESTSILFACNGRKNIIRVKARHMAGVQFRIRYRMQKLFRNFTGYCQMCQRHGINFVDFIMSATAADFDWRRMIFYGTKDGRAVKMECGHRYGNPYISNV